MAVDADQEAGALVPYLLGRTAKETWSFAIDASAYGKQDHLHDVAQRKGDASTCDYPTVTRVLQQVIETA